MTGELTSKEMTASYSQEWFAAALDAMTDFVLIKGPRSRLLWANKAFREYYGMSNSELAEVIDSPASNPDDTLAYVRDDRTVMTSGQPLRIIEPITDGDGNVAYFETIKTKLGGERRTIGVSRPIEDVSLSERSASWHASRNASVSELSVFVAAMPLAVAMLDVQFRIRTSSEAFRRIFAPDASSLLGRDYESVCGDLPLLHRSIEATVRGGVPVSPEETLEFVAKDGEHRHFELRSQPWRFLNGSVGGCVVAFLDVTREKKRALRLREANEELTQFNYRVSHDLVAPLRSVKGLVAVARAESGEFQMDVLTRIETEVDRLSRQVRDVLELARADVKSQACHIELPELVAEVTSRYLETMEEAGIRLATEIMPTTVLVERGRIFQILDNLVDNAVKFRSSANKGPWIRVRCTVVSDSLRIEVSDNGLGVTPGHEDEIFDIFKRANSDVMGTGLGLYIVKKHTQRLGGRCRLASPRHPTVFEIEVPCDLNDGAKE